MASLIPTRLLLLAALAGLPAAASHAALRRGGAPSVPEQECDRLAQPLRRDMGEQAISDGASFADLRWPAARAACAKAMADFPGEVRFVTWAARAADKGGDSRTAARLYRAAADEGNPIAQNNLGTMYFNGEGVPRDLREAVKLYQAAVKQGYQGSSANLGRMYATGRGVQRDDREAVRLFQVAADDGEADAQNNLGKMYAEGRGGLARDLGQAVVLWRQAAAQGNAEAKGNLRKAGRS